MVFELVSILMIVSNEGDQSLFFLKKIEFTMVLKDGCREKMMLPENAL